MKPKARISKAWQLKFLLFSTALNLRIGKKYLMGASVQYGDSIKIKFGMVSLKIYTIQYVTFMGCDLQLSLFQNLERSLPESKVKETSLAFGPRHF